MSGPWEKYQTQVSESPKPWDKFRGEKPKSSTLPANAGLANFAASALGLPVDTIEGGINLTRAAQGAVAGKLGLTDWMPPMLEGSVGGSKWIRDKLRQTEMPGLSPDNPQSGKMADLQYKFTSRGGFIPGLGIPAAGSMVAEETLGPEWGPVGAIAPAAAIQGYNAARAPFLAKSQQQNALRDATLREGREAGYVVPPTKSGGGMGSAALESVGGKAALGQSAALKNQRITNELARKELGLPKDSPISMQAIEAHRNKLASPYREVASISDDAASTLEKLKQARFEANAYYKHYDVSADPSSLAKAKSLTSEVGALERALEGFAQNAGKSGLINELREARKQIAKTFDVERALNVSTGDVSAPILGRMVDKGKPLSGGLATAGKFQQAFPHYMREGASVQPPTAGALAPITSAALGMGGYGLAGPAGALAATAPLLRAPTRGLLLSGPYQNMVMPSYGPALNAPPAPALLYQLGILSQEDQQ